MILSPDLSDIEKSSVSDAERRVARLLHGVSNPDAVAFFSVKLRTARNKQMAEADFVILWNGVVIVVEVKGGGVQKFQGSWYSIDRYNVSHKLNSSPMDQAREAMHSLRDILKEDGLGWYADAAIVITPDIDSLPKDLEWKPTHWLTREQMTVGELESALDVVAEAAPAPPHNIRRAGIKDVRTRLFGEFSRMPVLDGHRGAVIEEQTIATNDQARVLAGLSRSQRISVLGGAGTGKSMVLVEAAKQESAAGRLVLVTFRSPALNSYFGPHLEDRDVTVMDFASLDPSKQYDVVLVDEAQDLMSDEAIETLDRVIAGGLEQGRWRMFLDPNNQAHVDGRFDADVFNLIREISTEYELGRNVRNTRSIVELVQSYLGADVGDPGIVNGERVQWIRLTEEFHLDAAMDHAKKLISDGVAAKDIWVIPLNADEATDETIDGVRVLSARNAKGLEAEHVIVCDHSKQYSDKEIASFYVATTRARVTLTILVTKSDMKNLMELVRKAEGKK